jgi:multidrug efflux pump subunit AcrB
MIMSIFFRDARLTVLAMIMILAAGASAFLTIGRQEDPTITNLFATILTPFPGAAPGRVEALVTEKIEQELREIPEIDTIRSTSRAGISVIQIELSQFISDAQIEQAWSEIRDALSDAARNLPPGVPEPEFDNDRTGAFTTISALVMSDGRTFQPGVVKRYAEALQDRLRSISGTKFVKLYGARAEELRVVIDPVRLSEIGLTARDVASAIGAADTKVQAGQVQGERASVLVEVRGEINSLQRVRDVPLITTADGRVVRVGDIGTVARTVAEPAASLARANGKPAVLIAARMEDDLQVDAWTVRVRAELATFEAALPAGIRHELLFDQSSYTAERLLTVLNNLAIGVGLVVAVLLLTLGWRSALIVATVLPLATMISVFGLQVSGVSIHQMSVTGLIVALGLLVDAAIVMTDDIRRRLEAGLDRGAAVTAGIRRLAVPLLASTVTTALAFMPMVLLPGPAGDFVGSIALAVIIMLGASLALALTITPALSGWLLKQTPAIDATSERRGIFHASIKWSIDHPGLSILASLIVPVIGFASFPTLTAQFFPGVDRDQFHIQVKLPDSAAIAQTEAATRRASEIILANQGIRQLTWVVGESAPAFYYNMIADQDNTPSFAEALVTTTSPQRTEELLPILQRQLDAGLPEARVTVRGLVQGPPVNAPVEFRLVGPDLNVLRTFGNEVRRIMLTVPEITQARTELVGGAPKVELDLDEERVKLTGLTLGDVANQLSARLDGTVGGSLIERSEELPVRVRVGADRRGSIDDLANANLVANGPQTDATGANADTSRYPGIPIAALGEVRVVPTESPIYRRNGERVNTVQGFVKRTVLPEEALKKVRAELERAGFRLPEGYRIEVGGDADARDETLRNLLASLGIILALTLATIVLTFGSYRLAAVTVVVAVLSIGLSLFALAVFRYPFGIQAVIGVIGSIGVSINAAIIIMTALQEDAEALAGDLARIAELVVAQSRHILSTTLTTFGGFLPLILEGGGFWPPFAMAIAGGVLLSTIVSFYFTPPVFALLAKGGRLTSTARSGIIDNRDETAPAPA